MKRGRILLRLCLLLLLAAGAADAVRYRWPRHSRQEAVRAGRPAGAVRELVLVYNADGGIYPSVIDFAHKLLSPSTYPCRLCYLSFGTFTMREEWKAYLDSLPYPKRFLHRDDFRRHFQPDTLPLPAILVRTGEATGVLVPAGQINRCTTLHELKALVSSRLEAR